MESIFEIFMRNVKHQQHNSHDYSHLPLISFEIREFIDEVRAEIESNVETLTEEEEAIFAELDSLYGGDGSFDCARAAALIGYRLDPSDLEGLSNPLEDASQTSVHVVESSSGAASSARAHNSVPPRIELQRRIRAKSGGRLIYKNPDTADECEALFSGYDDSSYDLTGVWQAFITFDGENKSVEASTISVIPTERDLNQSDADGKDRAEMLTQKGNGSYAEAPFPKSPIYPEAQVILEAQRKKLGDLFKQVDKRDGYPPQVEMVREPSEGESLALKVIYLTAPSEISVFITRQGSRYKVSGRSTQRVAQPDWPPGIQTDSHAQFPSRTTYYIAHNDLQKFSLLRASRPYTSIRRVGHQMVALFYDSGPDKGMEIGGTRAFAYSYPSLGLFPLQVWGCGATRTYHFGNQIFHIL